MFIKKQIFNTIINKNFIFIIAILFIISFLSGMNYDKFYYKNKKNLSTEKTSAKIKNYPLNKKTHETITANRTKKKLDMVILMQKLQQSKDADSLNKLMNESMSLNRLSRNLMLYLTVKQWGKIAPMQCLAKLESIDGGLEYISPLFSSWADRNPEAAISYYETHYMGKVSELSSDALSSIIMKYAKFDLKKADFGLNSHANTLSKEELESGKKALLYAVSEKNPELLPQYISNMEEECIKEMAYVLGINWGNHTIERGKWIDSLPKDSRIKAEAGRIMGLTKGDPSKINDHTLELPLDDVVNVSKELAHFVFYDGDGIITDRINWIADNLPEKDISSDLKSRITIWMREDRKNAKSWLDSLPPSSKKDMFQQLYNDSFPVWHSTSSIIQKIK